MANITFFLRQDNADRTERNVFEALRQVGMQFTLNADNCNRSKSAETLQNTRETIVLVKISSAVHEDYTDMLRCEYNMFRLYSKQLCSDPTGSASSLRRRIAAAPTLSLCITSQVLQCLRSRHQYCN